jgi:3'-phosphoadenosine 5'-phosphosulfate sulfotransferase
MEDPMPNIITLPSKRCPPLHLQAPSWRHMLRLLARLSNTRIEPTIEAMSDTKAALKLRTVIQFVLVRFFQSYIPIL